MGSLGSRSRGLAHVRGCLSLSRRLPRRRRSPSPGSGRHRRHPHACWPPLRSTSTSAWRLPSAQGWGARWQDAIPASTARSQPRSTGRWCWSRCCPWGSGKLCLPTDARRRRQQGLDAGPACSERDQGPPRTRLPVEPLGLASGSPAPDGLTHLANLPPARTSPARMGRGSRHKTARPFLQSQQVPPLREA